MNKRELSGSSLVLYVMRKYKPKTIAIAFSGGIDSLATALIVLDTVAANVKKVIVFNNTTNEIPESLRYTRRMFSWFKEHYDNVETIELLPSRHYSEFLVENFEIAARMFLAKNWFKNQFRCCYHLKEAPANRFYGKRMIRVKFTGLRGEESFQRYLFMRETKGLFTRGKIINAMPLWNWKRKQVFSFVKNHPLKPEVNPCYSMGFDGTGCLLCPVKFFFGQRDSLKAMRKYYPAAYRLGCALRDYFLSKISGQKRLIRNNHPILKLIR